jgi:hypothetical protein
MTLSSLGVASIITEIQSLKIGTVVKRTITAKIKVVMGSAIWAFGTKYMMSAAITTPIL